MIIMVGSGVLGDGAQRRQHRRAVLRRQPHRQRQRPVLVQPPGQPPPQPRLLLHIAGHGAVRPGEPLQLVGRHRPRHLGQIRIRVRAGDPGQRPHLRKRQPPGGELAPDHRQRPERPGHPDMLTGGTRRQLALPRQPRRARRHVPLSPATAAVELGQQHQEPAGRRRQVPGQLTNLRLQHLQRPANSRTLRRACRAAVQARSRRAGRHAVLRACSSTLRARDTGAGSSTGR